MARTNYATRIFWLTFAAVIPSLVIAIVLIWQTNISPYGQLFITLVLCIGALGFALAIKTQINFQFQTLTNLVEAIRCGDFSLRGTRSDGDGPLSELVEQINLLSDALLEQRLASEEAFRLLDKAIREINVAILAFDGDDRVKLANPAASKLMNKPIEELIGCAAKTLSLDSLISEPKSQLIERSFPGASGRWQIRCDSYREQGLQRKLLFINDLRQVLREEEIKAWKNIMRVMSHEVNNSLFPIISLGNTLKKMVNQPIQDDEWQYDVNDGLDTITERAQQLSDFVKRYAKVAKMPTPQKVSTNLTQVFNRVLPLFANHVSMSLDQAVLSRSLFIDVALIEQLLINLIKNGIEAGTRVSISGADSSGNLVIHIRDDGPGISNPTNLFVPFYTTKPKGSGIGLVVCRQIVEAHDGLITLDNHQDGGCIVTVTLPTL